MINEEVEQIQKDLAEQVYEFAHNSALTPRSTTQAQGRQPLPLTPMVAQTQHQPLPAPSRPPVSAYNTSMGQASNFSAPADPDYSKPWAELARRQNEAGNRTSLVGVAMPAHKIEES